MKVPGQVRGSGSEGVRSVRRTESGDYGQVRSQGEGQVSGQGVSSGSPYIRAWALGYKKGRLLVPWMGLEGILLSEESRKEQVKLQWFEHI